MNHLHLKHEAIHKEVIEINKATTKIKEIKPEKEDEKERKRKKLLDCCVRLISVHGRPFEYLEDKAFRDIKALISPDFIDEANSKKVKGLISDKAHEIKLKIKNELERKMFSVKIDSATCMDRQFIGINVQYIKEAKIVVRNLCLMEVFVRQTAENLKVIIEEVFADFRIPLRNIYSITTDNGSNYLKVTSLLNQEIRNEDETEDSDSEDERDDHEQTNNSDTRLDDLPASDTEFSFEDAPEATLFKIPSIRCAAHTLQLCIKFAINNDPRTESVIETCRSVVKILRRPLMKIKIKSQNLRKPIIDCSTRWASTYFMLHRLKELKPICDSSDDIAELIGENFWIDMINIMTSLKPAAEATERLQAKELTLGDFYSIWIICRTKSENLNLPLAKDIATAMQIREKDLLANEAFLAAIFMDPRWKVVLSDREKDMAKCWVKVVHQQIELINRKHDDNTNRDQESSSPLLATASSSQDTTTVPNLPTADNYYGDLQSLELMLNETQRVRASDAMILDFDYFLAEHATFPRVAITENVLEYWSHKLPHKLAEVALIILAAPATQVSVERLFSVLKFILTPLRNRLLDQTIKNIVLIKCNEDLLDD